MRGLDNGHVRLGLRVGIRHTRPVMKAKMDGLSTTHFALRIDFGEMSLLSDELSTSALHVAHLIDGLRPLALSAILWHVED